MLRSSVTCLIWLSFLAAGSCDFTVRGLPLVGEDAAAVDLAGQPDDLAMTPADGSPGDGAIDLSLAPDLLAPPDLAACGACTNGCAPCCKDVFTSGAANTTSCNGTACLDCQESCGKMVGTCNLGCAGGATCHAVATQTNDAHANCTGGSTCQLTCSKVNGGCTIDCTGASHCRLTCTMTTCSFSSCSGGAGEMSCPNGDVTCNEAC